MAIYIYIAHTPCPVTHSGQSDSVFGMGILTTPIYSPAVLHNSFLLRMGTYPSFLVMNKLLCDTPWV